jgi:hypothetical protein
VFYDVAHQRLLEQMSRHDSLDAKVLAAFSFGSTVLPITFGLLSIAEQDEPKSDLFQPLIYAAVFVYTVVLILSALAFLRRQLSVRPNLPTMHDLSEIHPTPIMYRWAAREFIFSINENEAMLGRKAQFVGWAIVFSVLDAILLAAAAAVTFL